VTWAEIYLRTKWHLDLSNHLAAIIDMGRKVVGCCTPSFWGAGSSSNTMWPVPRPTSVSSGIQIHPTVWMQQTWAENWGLGHLFSWSCVPSNTMWPGPRPTYMPRFILIHPSVWPQYTNVADIQTDRKRSNSIGRIV